MEMVTRPLTIVQMLPELESGGVERGTLELGKYLVQHGQRSIVISGGGRLVKQLEEEGSEHIQWDIGKKSPITLRFVPKLKRLFTREKVDILHLRSRMPAWVGYVAWKSLPEQLRPRLVTTFHGFYSVNRYSAVMTKGEKIIAISKTISQHIQDAYNIPHKRIKLIYRGFDDSKFNALSVNPGSIENLKKKWNLPYESPPVIMLPGRLTRLKGHEIFINVLKQVEKLSWLAVFVGDADESSGYLSDLQKLLADLQLGDRVRFVGYCENMPAAYLLSDIVVSATSARPEAFGRVAVEAQAMGRPVIATAHGGSLETILPDKTGWLVSPSSDPKSLAEALEEAIGNTQKRKEFGKSGVDWVRKNFSTNIMCEKTVKLYNNLVEEKSK